MEQTHEYAVMEQARRTRAHLERVLLVCGLQNAGKSTLLRAMLGDKRLGGAVPTERRITPRALSRERCLCVHVTSPHELHETEEGFYEKIDTATATAWEKYWRVNYARAVQPSAFNNMPGIVDICSGLKNRFNPERIRIVQLVPDYENRTTSQLKLKEVDGLRRLGVEVVAVDARKSDDPTQLSDEDILDTNSRILADFFDFS